MAYTKTTWVNDQAPDIDADNLNKMEQGIADAQFPEDGVSGQLLAKTIDGQEWVDAPNSAVWGLIAGDIEDQIDLNETFGKEKELTQAQYDALPSTKLTDDVAYYIKDGTDIPQASVISASGVQYDNTQSGMSATNVQGAMDELKSGLSKIDLAALGKIRFAASTANDNVTVRWYLNDTDYYMVAFTPTQIRYSKVISGESTLLWAITA